MSEQNVNPTPDGSVVHPPVATTERAVEYITGALTNSALHMKEACKELGWSFPRIRSRALTIAKKLNSTIVKISRGVYILEPIVDTPAAAVTAEDSTVVASDTVIVDHSSINDDDEPTLNPDEVEAALLGDNKSVSSE